MLLNLGLAPRFLFLGAHSDDIEIGCGGTIIRLLKEYPDATVDWVVFAAVLDRRTEAINSAEMFLHDIPNMGRSVTIRDFRDGMIGSELVAVKTDFEKMKERFSPDVIFTHYHKDAHQDHRLVSELTYQTFRSHFVLEYEIPKRDPDLGNPNVYFALDERTRHLKITRLMHYFGTQRSRDWFTPETFEAQMRLRGINGCSPTGYAEGFYCRRMSF